MAVLHVCILLRCPIRSKCSSVVMIVCILLRCPIRSKYGSVVIMSACCMAVLL